MTEVVREDQPYGTTSAISNTPLVSVVLPRPVVEYQEKQKKTQRAYDQRVADRKDYPEWDLEKAKTWATKTYTPTLKKFHTTIQTLKSDPNSTVKHVAQTFLTKDETLTKESEALTPLINLIKDIADATSSNVQQWQQHLGVQAKNKDLPEQARGLVKEVQGILKMPNYPSELIKQIQIKLHMLRLRYAHTQHKLRETTYKLLSKKEWTKKIQRSEEKLVALQRENIWCQNVLKESRPTQMLQRVATLADSTLRTSRARAKVKGVVTKGQENDRQLRNKQRKLKGQVRGGSKGNSAQITKREVQTLLNANKEKITKINAKIKKDGELAAVFQAPKQKPKGWKKISDTFYILYNELKIEALGEKLQVLPKLITWFQNPDNEKKTATIKQRRLQKRPSLYSLLAMHDPKLRSLTKDEIELATQVLLEAADGDQTVEPILPPVWRTGSKYPPTCDYQKAKSDSHAANHGDEALTPCNRCHDCIYALVTPSEPSASPKRAPDATSRATTETISTTTTSSKKSESWSPPTWMIVVGVATATLAVTAYWKRAQLRELVSTLRARLGRG